MISKLESYVNSVLTKYPNIKKVIKRVYQLGIYSVSPKIKSEGNIIKLSPDDGYEYFFGYYDKSPWDMTERYVLCLKAKQTYKDVAPAEPAEIILIDTQTNHHETINKTHAWNVQQGCMLQWLGPEFDEKIMFNDFRDGQLCSIIYNIKTKEEQVIEKPVYDVAKDGSFAITLDFSRLHTLRPGYGYSNVTDSTEGVLLPEGPCMWKVDLINNQTTPIATYEQLYQMSTRPEMEDAAHGVNHIMINPYGTRFMFLHRWLKGNKKYSRLITADINGTNRFILNDDNMTSHSYWKNDTTILSYARKHSVGDGYFIFKDKTNQVEHVLEELTVDGHPSYSPNGQMIVTDTYPDRSRLQTLYVIQADSGEIDKIGRVHAPFKYDNDFRCDLHPRWDRSNNKIAFDSVFEGKRGLYMIDINERDNHEKN